MHRFGLIGCPISQSLSPRLFAAAYASRYEYDLLEYADFRDAFNAFMQGPYLAVNVTAPFKEQAFRAAEVSDSMAKECQAANILKKTERGVEAFNSDVFAVREILRRVGAVDVAVIGFGGAGKAALVAARECGCSTRLFRHDEIGTGVDAQTVVYTLPKAVPGCDKIHAEHLLEANYVTPCLTGADGYISGYEWLVLQARFGYEIMTGETAENLK